MIRRPSGSSWVIIIVNHRVAIGKQSGGHQRRVPSKSSTTRRVAAAASSGVSSENSGWELESENIHDSRAAIALETCQVVRGTRTR